jgi:hypothetical protein
VEASLLAIEAKKYWDRHFIRTEILGQALYGQKYWDRHFIRKVEA